MSQLCHTASLDFNLSHYNVLTRFFNSPGISEPKETGDQYLRKAPSPLTMTTRDRDRDRDAGRDSSRYASGSGSARTSHSKLAEFFVKGDRIHREVMQMNVAKYLGPEAHSRPSTYNVRKSQRKPRWHTN